MTWDREKHEKGRVRDLGGTKLMDRADRQQAAGRPSWEGQGKGVGIGQSLCSVWTGSREQEEAR